MSVELTEALLAKAAGWDAMKRARAYLEQGQVVSSYWAPPLLRGVVQSSESSYRASLVIHNEIDIENLCNCRESREWGGICAHVVAVGLHWLKAQKRETDPAPARPGTHAPEGDAGAGSKMGRWALSVERAAEGTPLYLFVPRQHHHQTTRNAD